jgi:PKD repeat protein
LNITTTPSINAIGIDGAINNPADTSGANVEVVLDIQIILGIVPKATINVYFAPNSFQGFYNAIKQAIIDKCNIISISWGAPEVYWTSETLNSFNALFQSAVTKNISIIAAAGDNGSSDGAPGSNVDFPSSSPYVLACGGTSLTASTNSITNEKVWNNNPTSSSTGGGISKVFPLPAYQKNLLINGKAPTFRCVPDICGNADPNTGYVIYMNSTFYVIGGTSAVSPLWSGLLARINQSLNINVGSIHSILYSKTGLCRDIILGNNGDYSASKNWDLCTGWGSPIGQNILSAFNSNPSPIANFTPSVTSGNLPLMVNFTDISTFTPTSWLWNFGDTITTNDKNPSHMYNNAGTYTVTLTVTNSFGSSTKSNTITVNYPTIKTTSKAIPQVSFTATIKSLTVNFTNTSTNNPTSWLWNFGDNATSADKNPTHTYSSKGNYTISLTATNTTGSTTSTFNNLIVL